MFYVTEIQLLSLRFFKNLLYLNTFYVNMHGHSCYVFIEK